jgi:hypothetical protein
VSGEVVHDDVDLLAGVGCDRFLQKSQEVLAVLARPALAEDLTGTGVQRGEQVRRAVPDVVADRWTVLLGARRPARGLSCGDRP